MSKRVSEKASLELTFLAALDSVHADVDLSEIAEIQDWSRAVRGKFYGAAVKGTSRLSNLRPSLPPVIVTDAPGSSGVVVGVSGSVASYGSVQYSYMAIPQLIAVCTSESSEAAWHEVIRRFQPLIAGAITRVVHRFSKVSHELVDDLIQEVFLKVCKDNFRTLRSVATAYDESALFGFLKVIAANTAQDYFRSAASSKRGAALEQAARKTDLISQEHVFSSVAASDPERKVLLGEIDKALKTHGQGPNFERDQAIFWLYYSHGLTAKAISDLPGINLTVKGVESTLFRLTRQIKLTLTQRTKNPK